MILGEKGLGNGKEWLRRKVDLFDDESHCTLWNIGKQTVDRLSIIQGLLHFDGGAHFHDGTLYGMDVIQHGSHYGIRFG